MTTTWPGSIGSIADSGPAGIQFLRVIGGEESAGNYPAKGPGNAYATIRGVSDLSRCIKTYPLFPLTHFVKLAIEPSGQDDQGSPPARMPGKRDTCIVV